MQTPSGRNGDTTKYTINIDAISTNDHLDPPLKMWTLSLVVDRNTTGGKHEWPTKKTSQKMNKFYPELKCKLPLGETGILLNIQSI
jgi:hypothetical protein